ncbi:hypothetical protein nbrc107697_29830 [Gordonia crocea]|uniref:Xylose isomerase-like TIM barrel domain-containing protein n=1 Tax=Gordonia crocea TaxID=589162 RepID=A0A7I9V0G7_9ACTN|nr:hypothetical protein nbrc107697_29830 [Gordonia crocea]
MIGRVQPELGVTAWTLPVRGVAAVRWAAEHGFAHLHLDLVDVEAATTAGLRTAAAESHVRLAGLAINRLELTGVAGTHAEAAVAEAIDVASDLEVRYVYLPSFEQAEITGGADLERTAELLRLAGARAAAAGVTVATENVLPGEQLSTLFALVGDDGVELLFDTQNLVVAGVDHREVLAAHTTRIRSFVHVKDGAAGLGDRRLGDGGADVAGTIRQLCAGGFTGVYVIENDYRTGAADAAAADARWLRKVLAMRGDGTE